MRFSIVPPKTRKVKPGAFRPIATYECPCGKEVVIGFFPVEDNVGILHESPCCARYLDEDAKTFLETLRTHRRRRDHGTN